MLVLKFGGTSLARKSCLVTLAERVKEVAGEGQVLVVVSALAGVTDTLAEAIDAVGANGTANDVPERLLRRHVDLAREILPARAQESLRESWRASLIRLRDLLAGLELLGECPATIRHRILAVGEDLSLPLVTAWLRRMGLVAEALDARSMLRVHGGEGIETLVDFTATEVSSRPLVSRLAAGTVGVVSGFLASDSRGQTVTLGRGASDHTATILASVLAADRVEIWTDVDGVLSACPRLVPEATVLPRLSYAGAALLARFGAKVLHPETLEPVAGLGIPVWIRNTARPEQPGTRIGPDLGPGRESTGEDLGENVGSAVAVQVEVCRLRFSRSRRGASRILACLERLRLHPLFFEVDPMEDTLSLVVDGRDEACLRMELEREGETVLAQEGMIREGALAALAVLVPPGTSAEGWVGGALQALQEAGVRVGSLLFPEPGEGPGALRMLISRAQVERAVRALHARLCAPPGFDPREKTLQPPSSPSALAASALR